ncbi:MAG: hypothetical protein M3O86_04140 [Actinomycetota bacterium]|nr:hypothetical protein [Actinomycetota bacterium]
MRRSVLLLSVLVLLAAGAVPVGAVDTLDSLDTVVDAGPGPGGFTSDNVTYVGSLPEESSAVGGRVIKVGDQVRFYATGVKGLSIYDVTTPATPKLLGRLVLPHEQNEDVSVSDDGNRVVIGADGGLLVPLMLGRGLHVIDTSNPANPKTVGFHADSNHTVSCADAKCDYVYGSGGNTYDLTDPTKPTRLPKGWQQVVAEQRVTLTQTAHDLSRDATGLIITDTVPRVMLDPRQDPTNPTVVTTGKVPGSKNLAYQHNNLRPRAEQWQPRAEGDTDPLLRPGEMMIGNGETNLRPRCGGGSNGPIATWDLRNFDQGAEMKPLEIFRPVANGTYADGNPAVNVLGCSGHYFTERNNMLAAAWFEHGTRFIEVDPTNGKMKEVGFYQPVVGSAGAAYWIDDEYVYVTDYERGIDIIKINRTAPAPTQAEIETSWLAKLDAPASTVAERERYVCSLATAK